VVGRSGKTHEAIRRICAAIGGRLGVDLRIRFSNCNNSEKVIINYEALSLNQKENSYAFREQSII